jgi:Uncharacterized protein conserved in bacteria (DUF2064)
MERSISTACQSANRVVLTGTDCPELTADTLVQAFEQLMNRYLVYGGSSDDTVTISAELGVKVISSAQGHAHQMNVGSTAATGEILLFLNADRFYPWASR